MRILVVYFWCQKLEYNHSLHVTKCIQLGGQGGRYLGNILTIKDMLQYSESFRLLISLNFYLVSYLSYKYIFLYLYIMLQYISSWLWYCSLFSVDFTLPLLWEDKVILFCIINDITDRGEGKYEEDRKEYDTKFP